WGGGGAMVGGGGGGGLAAFVVGLGLPQRAHRFERELGVDDQRPLIGQEDRAVRAAAVRERELKRVAILRQAVLDDDFHARLPEGAALLLVGQDALQRGHLRGEIRDVLLGAVDHRE